MATKKVKVETEEAAGVEVADSHYKLAPKSFYAVADFEIPKLGIEVKAGDQFTPPAGWTRDASQEALLLASKVKRAGAGESVGIAFSYFGEVVNPGEKEVALRERRQHVAVLPLEER